MATTTLDELKAIIRAEFHKRNNSPLYRRYMRDVVRQAQMARNPERARRWLLATLLEQGLI